VVRSTRRRTRSPSLPALCKLDYSAEAVDKPLLVVIDGRDKPFRTELAEREYRAVRKLGEEYLGRNPRSLA